MHRANVKTIYELVNYIYEQPELFIRTRNLGKHTAREILDKMKEIGVKIP